MTLTGFFYLCTNVSILFLYYFSLFLCTCLLFRFLKFVTNLLFEQVHKNINAIPFLNGIICGPVIIRDPMQGCIVSLQQPLHETGQIPLFNRIAETLQQKLDTCPQQAILCDLSRNGETRSRDQAAAIFELIVDYASFESSHILKIEITHASFQGIPRLTHCITR